MPSNGSTKGSHASKCLLNVDAAIEQINTALIVSNLPCVARFILVIVVSKIGVTYIFQNYFKKKVQMFQQLTSFSVQKRKHTIPQELSRMLIDKDPSFNSAVILSGTFGLA
jgi:hypothetical protein